MHHCAQACRYIDVLSNQSVPDQNGELYTGILTPGLEVPLFLGIERATVVPWFMTTLRLFPKCCTNNRISYISALATRVYPNQDDYNVQAGTMSLAVCLN